MHHHSSIIVGAEQDEDAFDPDSSPVVDIRYMLTFCDNLYVLYIYGTNCNHRGKSTLKVVS